MSYRLLMDNVFEMGIFDFFNNKKKENARQEQLRLQYWYLQPIITQYFIDNKSEIWLLFLIAHSKR